jgi:carboxyl-terminal processing protease
MSRALIAGAVLGAGLVSGGMIIQGGAVAESAALAGTPRLFDQVVARVRNDYIDSIPVDELYRRAAIGLAREIDDPYSMVLSPDAFSRLRESSAGRYAGIGVELDVRDGFVTVIAPIAGTPADSAGIRPGDRIVQVDGRSTVRMTMDEVQQALRGASGTTVRLSVQRGDTDTRTLTLRRTQVRLDPVRRVMMPAAGVGYVELATFSDDAAARLRRAVDSLRTAGATSLVLDLRGNPGGLLEQGIAVADLFLRPGQVIASTRGRTGEADQDFSDSTPEVWPRMPVVVLVDSGSASASEIVAGALQDHGRATVMGTSTYGKGSAQSVFPLIGERALKLTTARWFTPEGRSIDRDSTSGGIMPDVVVPRDTAAAVDPVLERAIQRLRPGRRP